jgi:hypothetical protein
LSILRVLLSATRGVNDKELLDDILPSPLDTVEEITEFCSRLDDEEFRKKMVGSSTKEKSIMQSEKSLPHPFRNKISTTLSLSHFKVSL